MRSTTFSRSDFQWDGQRNEYRCPAGKAVRPRQRHFKKLPTLIVVAAGCPVTGNNEPCSRNLGKEETTPNPAAFLYHWIQSDSPRMGRQREKAEKHVPGTIVAATAHAQAHGETISWGFANLRVHDLKHTFGRRLRAAGVSLETRKVLLGHTNGDITSHYSAPEINELLETATRVYNTNPGKIPSLTILKRKTG